MFEILIMIRVSYWLLLFKRLLKLFLIYINTFEPLFWGKFIFRAVRCCKPSTRTCIFKRNPKSTKSKFLKNLFQQNKTETDHFINKMICLLKLLNFFIYAIKINSHEFSIIINQYFII